MATNWTNLRVRTMNLKTATFASLFSLWKWIISRLPSLNNCDKNSYRTTISLPDPGKSCIHDIIYTWYSMLKSETVIEHLYRMIVTAGFTQNKHNSWIVCVTIGWRWLSDHFDFGTWGPLQFHGAVYHCRYQDLIWSARDLFDCDWRQISCSEMLSFS